MLLLKECGRCGGDLYEEDDGLQVDIVCLQCGYRRSVASWMDETHWATNARMNRALKVVR